MFPRSGACASRGQKAYKSANFSFKNTYKVYKNLSVLSTYFLERDTDNLCTAVIFYRVSNFQQKWVCFWLVVRKKFEFCKSNEVIVKFLVLEFKQVKKRKKTEFETVPVWSIWRLRHSKLLSIGSQQLACNHRLNLSHFLFSLTLLWQVLPKICISF